MSGPSLQLNITAPGQAKVDQTVNSIERLAAALKTLPGSSAELARVIKAINSAGSGSGGGLKGAGGELRELVTEIKTLSAQLGTAFGSLEETIKKGYGRAASATAAGEAAVKSAANASKGRTVSSVGAAGQPIQVPLTWFAKMQAGSEKIRQAEAAAKAKANSDYLAWIDSQVAANSAATAKLAAAYDKSIQTLQGKTAKLLKAVTMPGYAPAGPGWWEAQLAAQAKASASYISWLDSQIAANNAASAKLKASYDKSINSLQKKTAQVVKAATMPAYRPAGPDWWEAQLASQKKSADKYEAWLDSQIAANNAAYRRLQQADAAFAASSARAQARSILGARTQLDAGIGEKDVQSAFGPRALAAAQSTTTGAAYAAAHGEARKSVDELGNASNRAAPKLLGLTQAMNDGHSAARGLASGFGAMFLTWGNIAPLLAGAALSNSFVQAVKTGMAVRQSLEELRVLSEESTSAVAGLEKQLASLGRSGPFGPAAIADAMKTLSLAGLSAKEVGQALKPTLDFAVTGGVEIQKSAESLVAIGTAYGYQADQFSLVADAVSKAAAVSMSSVDGMMESFRASSIVAQAYGVSLRDSATALALLANIGIRRSAAGTSLRQMYSELSGATASTRKAMEKLGVEVVNSEGKMRPLVDIVKDLSKALENYSGKGRIAAIQALSNERGSKAIVAALTALEKKAKDAGTTVSTELDRISAAIASSAGFNAISASKLASTPLNLMKGVSASLQTALNDAYRAMEPMLILFAEKARSIFNSQGFQDGLTSMVRGVGAVVSALVDGVQYLGAFAAALAVYKLMQLFSLALSGAAIAAGMLRGTLVMTQAGIVSTAAAAAAGTTALGGMALAARGLAMALRLAGPLGIALTLAAVAYSAYGKAQEDASTIEARANLARENNTIESLRRERDRLREVTTELARGADMKAADAAATLKQAAAEDALQRAKGRAPFERAAAAALSKYDQETKRNGGAGRPGVLALYQQEANNALGKLQAYDLAAAQRAKDASKLRQDVMDLSYATDLLGQERERQNSLRGLGTEDWHGGSAGGRGGFGPDPGQKQYDLIRKAYERQVQLIDQQTREAEELRNAYVEQGLLAESQAAVETERMQAETFARRIAAFTSYYSALDAIRGKFNNADALADADQAMRDAGETLTSARAHEIRLAQLKPLKAMGPEPALDMLNKTMALDLPDTRPAWKKFVDEGKSAFKVLEDSKLQFMDGWIASGRDMWQEWLETGRVSTKSLKDLLVKTFADITYKRFLADPMAKIGEGLFERLLGPVGAASGDGTKKQAGDALRNVFAGLGDSALALKDSLTSLGGEFWRLLVQAGQALVSLLSSGGAAGASGGIGSFLGSLFGGGGGGGGMESVLPDMIGAFAKGGAFNGAVHAFAKGGIMNSVVNQPHVFRFGLGGSKLGVMGEAGPEAVMPLARDSSGTLGVRTVGGGAAGGAGPRTVVIIENHGGGAAPEVSQEMQPNGDEMIRVVLNATAKDITRGGPVRKALKSTTRTTPNLPRY